MLKLVGDNPFNGVSHLSQEKALLRSANISDPAYAAKLLKISLDSGADGFMFSISDTTLSILKVMHHEYNQKTNLLYAITPAAGESARSMGPSGGVEGLIKKNAKQIVSSRNFSAVSLGIRGSLLMNPDKLIRSFISLEISKIRSAAGKDAQIKSIMLHEIVTDLALALDLKWVFQSVMNYLADQGITPGFETRNFSFLVNKFREWDFDLGNVVIAAPFNKLGFLMVPSKRTCEETLNLNSNLNVIAISVLAAGYLKPTEAVGYIKSQPKLKGIAIAVSKEEHAKQTFTVF